MAKRSFKYSYLKSINEHSTLSQVWNKVKFLKTNRYKETPIILQLENVKHTLQEPVEVANELAYQFAKTSSILFHKEPFVYHMVEKEFLNLNFETDSQYLYNQPFSMRELELAISQIKKNTSPGQDMLIYPFFQHLVEENKKIILKFFNLIWQSGGFPEDWKISLLVPILKPGKLHTDPSSYRPIALTSCLCKLMERMVLQRLLLYLQEHNVLSPNQSGFRKNFSTSDSLLFLECSIQETFLKNEYLVAVFLDIEKAYDTVWIHGLLLKLHHLGLRGNLPVFISNFLQNRKIRVQIGNLQSEIFDMEFGVPQGSVLSPCLFSLMINDVFKECDSDISYSLYADDCALWISDSDLFTALGKIQVALGVVSQWSEEWGLNFSPKKTKAMVFTKRPYDHIPLLSLCGSEIEYTTTHKFLGLNFDCRLTWKCHVKELTQRSEKALLLLRYISSNVHGVDRDLLLYLYKVIVRSKIDYGSFIYDSLSESNSLKLDRLQYQGIRQAVGALKCTRVDFLEAEAHIMPLNIRRKLLGLNYISSRIYRYNHPVNKFYNDYYIYDFFKNRPYQLSYVGRLKCLMEENALPLQKLAKIPLLIDDSHLNLTFDDDFVKYDKRSTSHEIYNLLFLEKINALQIQNFNISFTDGSKINNEVGCAFLYNDHIFQYKLPNYSSVFTSEAYAIYRSLIFFNSKPHYKLAIFTDSYSVFQALQTNSSHHYLIYKIRNFCKLTCRKVLLIWIPGHVGIKQHDRVDIAAKESGVLGMPVDINISLSEFRGKISQICSQTWQSQWNRCRGWLPAIKPLIQNWSETYKLNRREQVVLSRLRLGTPLFENIHYFERSNVKLCSHCDVRLSVTHIFMICPLFLQQRIYLRQRCQELNLSFDINVLLSSIFPEGDIIQFLKDCKVFSII
jgi:hypothetical protein